MNIVFIHQNMPGQFKHLAAWFGVRPEHQAVFLTTRRDRDIPGVARVSYQLHRKPNPDIHHYLRRSEPAVLHGQAVARAILALKRRGFTPDIVIGHSAWGETLFVKDVLPDVPLLNYCEFYYRSRGADIGFDPVEPPQLDALLRARMRTTHLLLSLEACDRGWAPTAWQKSVHPEAFHDKITVVHEGIDTALMAPDADAALELPGGAVVRAGDEVVTYVARNLEPYRGFPTFMRALPRILAERPDARVVIVGGDEISYGAAPREGGTWRQKMLAEVALDPARVHFLGTVPYDIFRRVLQVSAVHVYLTYPFVLSWSMLEAMSCGCLIVGSRTPPVEEVIADGENGLLVDFFDAEAVTDRVIEALARPADFVPLRGAARETVLARYELGACFGRQLKMIEDQVGRKLGQRTRGGASVAVD